MSDSAPTERESPPARIAEELLIDRIPRLVGSRVLCTSLGRAQFAGSYASYHPSSRVTCNFLDLHLAQQARLQTSEERVSITCLADFPNDPVDLVAMPVSMFGDAELTQDLLQAACLRLEDGGTFVAASDNPRDHWLKEQLERLFTKVTESRGPTGVIYSATKSENPKKIKRFDCTLPLRDGERTISVVTRPGVFSHRRIDGGARAIIETMTIAPEARVLEIGCGSGAASLVASQRSPGVEVTAIDSNPRAVDCIEQGARLNQIMSVRSHLSAAGEGVAEKEYDVVLANPPYYSQHRIAALFVETARRALRPGGVLYLVTKHMAWYDEHLPTYFSSITPKAIRGYFVYQCL